MKIVLRTLAILIANYALFSCSTTAPPEPIGPIPSERQLAWHNLDYYAFVHFNMNTFTNMEWGTGGESPEQFNPSALDTRQWAKVAKEAGMEGIIITAKHHDGFCLWPTKTTEHSVKNSPWKNGKGDLIKDLADACREYGLKFGIYLSPWDRNHKDYGQPAYVAVFHEQLRELLSNYGEVFEVWFDGANGGSGYYGGANETRKIDNKTYYQWDKTNEIVRELQPNAVIFSDGGPDIRWVGNEEGWANETNWSIMRRDEIYPGWPRYVELRSGHEDGTHWLPAEVNVSIRPGWYYHPSEDHQVKSLAHLVKIYYESIGRNGNFLLNLPVDHRGLVHETDVKQLMALKAQIDQDFKEDLANGIDITADHIRGDSKDFSAENTIDGDPQTYWATNDGTTNGTITLTFKVPTELNRVLLQEYIPLGQRVQEFLVEAQVDENWVEIARQTTIGHKRILKFDNVKSSAIRITVLEAKGPPTLSNIELYKAPNLLTEPLIKRNKSGWITLEVPDKNLETYFSAIEGASESDFVEYKGPFLSP
ncbi:MAG: alpha-L-fucosidase, partial [Flavobacteriaceae bacterium]